MQSVHNEHCDYIYLVIIFFDINGGEEAIKHFTFLLNTVIENINNASLPEINTAYANILHKGHGVGGISGSELHSVGAERLRYKMIADCNSCCKSTRL